VLKDILTILSKIIINNTKNNKIISGKKVEMLKKT
jgi:hypothetical protein